MKLKNDSNTQSEIVISIMIFFIVDITVAIGFESQKQNEGCGSGILRALYKWPAGEERSSHDSHVHLCLCRSFERKWLFPLVELHRTRALISLAGYLFVAVLSGKMGFQNCTFIFFSNMSPCIYWYFEE